MDPHTGKVYDLENDEIPVDVKARLQFDDQERLKKLHMLQVEKGELPVTREFNHEEAVQELGILIDEIIELDSIKPYTPNRADRRAMSKNSRKKGRKKR